MTLIVENDLRDIAFRTDAVTLGELLEDFDSPDFAGLRVGESWIIGLVADGALFPKRRQFARASEREAILDEAEARWRQVRWTLELLSRGDSNLIRYLDERGYEAYAVPGCRVEMRSRERPDWKPMTEET